MVQTAQLTANDYRITIAPVQGRVEAFSGDTLIASSVKAMVMYETRLQPVVYFPLDDVLVQLTPNTEKKTFCPFKGTAEYFDVQLPGGLIDAGAWTYRKASPESLPVENYVSFMPNALTRLNWETVQQTQPMSGSISGPTVDWIIREAWQHQSPEQLIAAIGRKLVDDGVALLRLNVMIWSLHPQIAGRNYTWLRDTDEVRTVTPSYDLLDNPAYVNSPLRHVTNGLGGVRQRLTVDDPEFEFPIMDELKEQGATDYVAMPLFFSNGQTNVMSLASDHADGFTTANLGLIFEISPVISRYFEVFTLKENSKALLETYLGKRTGERVLGGEIRRRDGDEIEAAILFCDLRDSTALEETLDRDDYIELLNQFFEVTTNIVNDHGGEVLKFIGDAILAIFPTGGKQELACRNAQSAAMAIADAFQSESGVKTYGPIDCAMGIAFGGVTYGNVGSKERLDFTVIGSAANIAARLGDVGKSGNHTIVATGDILADHASAISLGDVKLRNVSEPIPAFALSHC